MASFAEVRTQSPNHAVGRNSVKSTAISPLTKFTVRYFFPRFPIARSRYPLTLLRYAFGEQPIMDRNSREK
jgi:hypothetical protein